MEQREHPQAAIGGYTIRRSARARRVSVRVLPEGELVVTLPVHAPAAAAAQAVAELADWIAPRIAAARGMSAQLPGADGTLPYLDRRLAIVAQEVRRSARIDFDRSLLLVPAQGTHAAVERCYRRAARAEIAPRLQRACARLRVSYTSLAIRSQRSRWASCSRQGAMSFNWRLLLAPERILEYVVHHEVCHLLVHDHSERFWALVESLWPGWRQERRWLSENGARLRLAQQLSGARSDQL
jgi:predicted metal-dependent hydrolase